MIQSLVSGVAATLSIIMLAGCASVETNRAVPSPTPPQPTPSPRELRLPDDDAAHDVPIEWWYYNGHLQSEEGREFSFHYVVFQHLDELDRRVSKYAQMGIIDLQDLEHRNYRSGAVSFLKNDEEGYSAELALADLGEFQLRIDAEGNHSIRGRDGESGDSIALDISRSEEAMLHEGIGWMNWPFGWTYYYSYPRMQSEGSLSFGGKTYEVEGEVWFDHQWGDFFVVGKPAGWQWFALHLDDGDSLMLSEVRGADGEVIAVDGTWMNGYGDQQVFSGEEDEIGIEVLDYWLSPHTGGEYPSSWRLSLPAKGLDVVLEPAMADQEIAAMPFGNQAAAYWEGRVEVFDADSRRKAGRGFVELSGYVDSDPLIWRTAED